MALVDRIIKREALEKKVTYIKKYFEGKTYEGTGEFGAHSKLQIMKVDVFADMVRVYYLGPNNGINFLVKQCGERIEDYFNVLVIMNWRGDFHP
jgi:hypothetical protein